MRRRRSLHRRTVSSLSSLDTVQPIVSGGIYIPYIIHVFERLYAYIKQKQMLKKVLKGNKELEKQSASVNLKCYLGWLGLLK